MTFPSHLRLHALDNLRAALMWLGIVLHVSVNHITGPALLPFRDTATTPVADMLLLFIHAFRMPTFSVLAGFLAAMMAAHRGHQAMLKNRMRRIALPFAIFWPLVFAAMIALVLVWTHLMRLGSFGIDIAVAPQPVPGRPILNTMHMWFLYYLFIFCVLAAVACSLAVRMPAAARAVNAVAGALVRNWWGVLILALPLAMIGALYPQGLMAPNGSFIPNLREGIHNGLFFIFGWALYRQRDTLLAKFSAQCWWYAVAGSVPYFAAAAMLVAMKNKAGLPYPELGIAFAYDLTGWLWSIALIGLVCRYLPTQNSVLRYLSDSSYWVFLVHMLGTIGFGALLFKVQLPGEVKMLINIAATTLVCLASYHLFVRNSWVGVLLNGRRKGRPGSAVAHAATV